MKTIYIKSNTTELRDILRNEGIDVCPCTEFEGWDWLDYHLSVGSVHGIPPYETDPILQVECGDRAIFLAELTSEDVCCESEDEFVELIKRYRNGNK